MATKQLPSKLIISVKEARKILGRESAFLSDEAIADIIRDYDQAARDLVLNSKVLRYN